MYNTAVVKLFVKKFFNDRVVPQQPLDSQPPQNAPRRHQYRDGAQDKPPARHRRNVANDVDDRSCWVVQKCSNGVIGEDVFAHSLDVLIEQFNVLGQCGDVHDQRVFFSLSPHCSQWRT